MEHEQENLLVLLTKKTSPTMGSDELQEAIEKKEIKVKLDVLMKGRTFLIFLVEYFIRIFPDQKEIAMGDLVAYSLRSDQAEFILDNNKTSCKKERFEKYLRWNERELREKYHVEIKLKKVTDSYPHWINPLGENLPPYVLSKIILIRL